MSNWWKVKATLLLNLHDDVRKSDWTREREWYFLNKIGYSVFHMVDFHFVLEDTNLFFNRKCLLLAYFAELEFEFHPANLLFADDWRRSQMFLLLSTPGLFLFLSECFSIQCCVQIPNDSKHKTWKCLSVFLYLLLTKYMDVTNEALMLSRNYIFLYKTQLGAFWAQICYVSCGYCVKLKLISCFQCRKKLK